MTEPKLDPSERILILTPDRNAHLKDFSGAFEPESNRLGSAYGDQSRVVHVPVGFLDGKTLSVTGDQRAFEHAARFVLGTINSNPDSSPATWTRIVLICHGWSTGLQLGFRSRKRRGADATHWNELIAALKNRLELRSITLFACSAGKNPLESKDGPGTGDNSIADLLRDETGCPVIAHTTAGHATRNPDLIVFERNAEPVIGGIVPCARGTAAYKNAVQLLTVAKRDAGGRLLGNIAPKGHSRPAFASIPLCSSASELHALLSSEPGT